MASLESTSRRIRAAAVSQMSNEFNDRTEVRRRQSRMENACEVGRTMLILVLIGLGIVALRYVLVLAYGFVH